MKNISKISAIIFSLVLICCKTDSNTHNAEDIKQTLRNFGDAVYHKDINKTMKLFDTESGIILAGSEENEFFKGPEEIKEHLKQFFNKPIKLSFDLKRIELDQNDQTAWVYSHGPATITSPDGSSSILPYRFTAVLVRVNAEWKIRLFNGSVPEKTSQ